MKRFGQLFLGLIVGIGVLALGVRGIAQGENNHSRCVRLGFDYFTRAYSVDAWSGRVMEYGRGDTQNVIPGSEASPDGKKAIDSGVTGVSEVLGLQAFPPRKTTLYDGSFGPDWQSSWSPDSQTYAFVVNQSSSQPTDTLEWDFWNVWRGRVESMNVAPIDRQYFLLSNSTSIQWSPDSRTIGLLLGGLQDHPTRLYLGDRETMTFKALDVPNLAEGAELTWSPDGGTIALFGQDAENTDMLRVMLYSVAKGTLTTAQFIGNPTIGGVHILESKPVWSPDGRYFYIKDSAQVYTETPGWDVFGIDGRAYFQVAPFGAAIGWRGTDSRLIVVDKTESGKQLIAFDPATGTKEKLLMGIIDGTISNDGSALILAVSRNDSSTILEHYRLSEGTLTQLMDGITRFDKLPFSAAPNIVKWYAGQAFHFTFLSTSGQVWRDFTGNGPLGPLAKLIANPGSPYVIYVWAPDEKSDSTIELLNLDSGARHTLLKGKMSVERQQVDPSGRIITLNLRDTSGPIQRVFTVDGAPIPLGDGTVDDYSIPSPDGQHAIQWRDQGGQPSPLMLVTSGAEPRRLRRMMNKLTPLIILWSPDSRYFVLRSDATLPSGMHTSTVEFYTADGEFLREAVVTDELPFNEMVWTACK